MRVSRDQVFQDFALKIWSDYCCMGPRRSRILIQRRTSMKQQFLGFTTDHDDDTTPFWIWAWMFFRSFSRDFLGHLDLPPWRAYSPVILSSRSALRCSLFFCFSHLLQNFSYFSASIPLERGKESPHGRARICDYSAGWGGFLFCTVQYMLTVNVAFWKM